MRYGMRTRTMVVAVLIGTVVPAAGCIFHFQDDCLAAHNCPPGTGGGSSSTSTMTRTGGGIPSCEGDPTKDPTIVRDDCGVFVSSSAVPGGDGTKAKPFQTFVDAASAGKARVYACAEAYTETKQVSFSGGVAIYGGFTDCTKDWTWAAGSKATITTAADVPGLVLGGGANAIESVSVTAPDATIAGGSSIAVLVNGGSLDMTNGDLKAGDAKAGDAGVTVADDPTLVGDIGANGLKACDAGANHPGPVGKAKTCATGAGSTAGTGGDGGQVMGAMLLPAGTGTDGGPADLSQPTKGKGGIGEGHGMPAATSCADGTTGAAGGLGASGDGANGTGMLSAKDGYQGVPGKDGSNGNPGQGGGGGGGAKGAKMVTCGSGPIDVVGASGGAGGTGGCGGTMGGGGKPGGSSIALVSLGATVTLAQVTLTAGKGGSGGSGGNGQSGGHGATGGNSGSGGSASDSCHGGDGGKGGNGGPGGGGLGGHSLGIASTGTAPVLDDATKSAIMPGAKGSGGKGGNMDTSMNHGADGIAASCWDFAANAACK